MYDRQAVNLPDNRASSLNHNGATADHLLKSARGQAGPFFGPRHRLFDVVIVDTLDLVLRGDKRRLARNVGNASEARRDLAGARCDTGAVIGQSGDGCAVKRQHRFGVRQVGH